MQTFRAFHLLSGAFTYALPGDRVFPEGVAVDPQVKRYYVSSTSDGTILRGAITGRRARVFLPGGADGRTTAIGVKVDQRGRLYVAGGATGSVFVYDIKTRQLLRRFDTGAGGFLNDIAITVDGDAYVTDSQRASLFRIGADEVEAGSGDTVTLKPFVAYPDFAPGFNANGIVAAGPDALVYVQSNLGRLVRLDLNTKTFKTIDLGGASVVNGDGLVLVGRTLYVVRNRDGLIAKIRLARDLASGRVLREFSDPTFRYPTTAAPALGRLLVVNSQFDKRPSMMPELPFTVSSVRRP